MLKNRLKELAKRSDNSMKVEIIKDSGLSQIRGGLMNPVCGALTDCNINSDVCPKLQSCGWN